MWILRENLWLTIAGVATYANCENEDFHKRWDGFYVWILRENLWLTIAGVVTYAK